jgi:hypothetical protein
MNQTNYITWGFTVIDFASVHSSARQSGKFAFLRVPLATSVTRLPPDGDFHPRRASRRAPPALLESISKWSQFNRLQVGCLRTTSQICTLIANFTAKRLIKYALALVLIPQRAGGSLNVHV